MKRRVWGLLLIAALLMSNLWIGNDTKQVEAAPYAMADSSITSLYNVPITYYDYLDDNEVNNGWKKYKEYGNNVDHGWSVFGCFNEELAKYYKDYLTADVVGNQDVTGLYFGNLLMTDKVKPGVGYQRAGEVEKQVNHLKTIYPDYWNNANNSNYFTSDNKKYSAYGLVYNTLSPNGSLQIANGVNAPWFDETFLAGYAPGKNQTRGKSFSSRFPFRLTTDENGVSYYEFDSDHGKDNIVSDGTTFYYKQGANKGVKDGASQFGLDTSSDNGGYGFFPFNQSGNGPTGLNFGFGAEMEIRFNLPKGGQVKGTNGQMVPIKFEFTGDDDVWVFIDGKLVLDMGGAHKKAHGVIDFSTLQAIVDTQGVVVHDYAERRAVSLASALNVSSSSELNPNTAHTMKIFYMERGMIESNLKIRFNMQPIEHEFSTEKEVNTTSVNEGLVDAVKEADEFNIQLKAGNTAAAAKNYDLIDSYGDTTTGLKTDQYGNFVIRDREKAVFKKQFDQDIGKNFTAVESVANSNKSALTYDTTWQVTDVENNSQVASGNYTTASFSYTKKTGDEFTPVRLNLKYTNTPQIGSLSVTKKTVDKNGTTYDDKATDFKFLLEIDLGGNSADQVIEEDRTDPTAIYFKKPSNWNTAYAYCYNTDQDKLSQWPGSAMTYVKDNIYRLSNVRGKWKYVIFSNSGNSQIPGQGQQGVSISNQGPERNCYEVQNGQLQSSTYQELVQVTKPASGGYKGYPLQYTIGSDATVYNTAPTGAFVLKSGQKATFKGIPVGANFRIKEVQADGYTVKDVTINGQTVTEDEMHYYVGKIQASSSVVETVFTNQKEETAVDLKAYKTVDNGTTQIQPGAFKFVLEGRSPVQMDGKWTENTSGIKYQHVNDKDGKISFYTLAYQKEGIYLYTIKEVIPKDDLTYRYDQSEYEVKVVVTAAQRSMVPTVTVTKIKDKDGKEIKPGEQVQDITSGIKFDNVTNMTSMTLQKVLVQEDGSKLQKSSWPSQVAPFTFILEKLGTDGQYQPCGNQKYTIPVGNKVETKYTDTAGKFTLSAEERGSNIKITFPELIIGTKYRIVEDLTDVRRYEFYSVTVNETQQVRSVTGRQYSSGDILLKKGDNDIVFQNYPLSEIQVHKKDANGNSLQGVSFKLEKKEDFNWIPVKGYENPVSTGQDGTILFQYLKAGIYRITEVQTLEGNVLLKDPVEVTVPFAYKPGDIVNGQTVTSDGLSYKVTFTIINDKAFDLPTTGATGITKYLMIGMALAVAAGTTLSLRQAQARNRRRRRKKRSR